MDHKIFIVRLVYWSRLTRRSTGTEQIFRVIFILNPSLTVSISHSVYSIGTRRLERLPVPTFSLGVITHSTGIGARRVTVILVDPRNFRRIPGVRWGVWSSQSWRVHPGPESLKITRGSRRLDVHPNSWWSEFLKQIYTPKLLLRFSLVDRYRKKTKQKNHCPLTYLRTINRVRIQIYTYLCA